MEQRARFLCAIWCALALASLAPETSAQEAIRIGTSSVGSAFYTIAIGASEVIQKHSGVNATVEPVGGSSERPDVPDEIVYKVVNPD